MVKRYSITELLALRGNAAIDIGQFTIYALENNLLRRNRPVPNTNPEPMSIVTRQNGRSTTSSEDSFQKPATQPQNTSQENDMESDSGFVKFLKQHSSPKHQRVTPGGKIVHVDGNIPIPEFKPPPTKTSDDCPSKVGKDTTKVASLQATGTEKEAAQSSGLSANSNGFKLDTSYKVPYERVSAKQTGITTANGREEAAPQTAILYPPLQSLQQLQVPLTGTDVYHQQPLALAAGFPHLVPVTQTGQETGSQLFLPDTTAWYQNASQPYVNQNPAFQNLSQHQSAPLLATVWPTVGKQGVSVPTIAVPDSQVTVPASYSFSGTSTLASGQLAPPLAPYSGSVPTYLADQNTQRSLQDLTKEYQSLSSQLENLDRYMAIHTFEMDEETKESLVEQRRNLVKDLDSARRYKEHLESNIKKVSSTSIEPVPVSGFQQDLVNNLALASQPALSRLVAVEQPTDYPLSLTLNSINTMPLQPSQAGYVPVIPTLLGWSEYPYNAHLSQDAQFIPQTYPLAHQLNDLSTASQPKSMANQQNPAEASTRPSLINISQLHRQIEEAARRGEPVDGLFEELARATEQSAAQRNGQRFGSSAGVQLTSAASDRTSSSLQQSFSTSRSETQRREGSRTETSDSLGSGLGASKSSSSSWMDLGGQNSGAGTCLEKDSATNKQPLRSFRHSRDVRFRGFVSQTGDRNDTKKLHGSRSMMLTPWVGRADQDAVASKACAPVISRVNAHGFLPSVDGANDPYDANTHQAGILIDFGSDDNVAKRSMRNQPWYLQVPRPTPDYSEVRRFFLDLEEDERRMIYEYQMRSMGDGRPLNNNKSWLS